MNRRWHEKHRLRRGASFDERAVWHRNHRDACGCRAVPEPIRRRLEQEDLAATMPPLTKAQRRSIARTIRDLEDPTRYLIVSRIGDAFSLYYDVSSGTLAHDDPTGGTLFKRRAEAQAVAATMSDGLEVLKVVVGKRGAVRFVDGVRSRRRKPAGVPRAR